MPSQLTFADTEFQSKKRKTRKEIFLARMENVIPWELIISLIEPYYPKAGKGRRPYPLETMLRIHLLQQWYSLSDPAAEDALYEIASMRRFVGLSLSQSIPDRTTIMNFRHLLEKHQLGHQIFEAVSSWLVEAGVVLREGTLVDATIIDAPSSTKNRSGTRDPDMHQTKKGNQWYFGMKAHIGVDARTGLTHSVEGTSANEHDLNQAHKLLHGQETFIGADSGYRGIEKREVFEDKQLKYLIADQPSTVKELKKHPRINKLALQIEYMKASIRAKVEHPFRIIKCQFGYTKTRYRGLAKNNNQLKMLFTLSNLVRVDQLIRASAR